MMKQDFLVIEISYITIEKKIVKQLQNLRSKALNGDLPIDKKLSTCYGWKIPKLL